MLLLFRWSWSSSNWAAMRGRAGHALLLLLLLLLLFGHGTCTSMRVGGLGPSPVSTVRPMRLLLLLLQAISMTLQRLWHLGMLRRTCRGASLSLHGPRSGLSLLLLLLLGLVDRKRVALRRRLLLDMRDRLLDRQQRLAELLLVMGRQQLHGIWSHSACNKARHWICMGQPVVRWSIGQAGVAGVGASYIPCHFVTSGVQ